MPYQPPLGDPSLPQPNIPPPFPPPPLISFRTPSRLPWIVAVAMTAAAGYGAYWGFGERAKWKAKAEVAEGKAHEALVADQDLHGQLSPLQEEKDALERNIRCCKLPIAALSD